MSLYNLARQVQSKGRNGDTMLVHMTPGEVQGLQALAMKHGGSLTINPETGLPEANILKAILPIAAGVALGPVGLGMSSAMAGLTVGGIATLTSGSLSKGLMAGLGAYGGAGISGGLLSSGNAALGAAAAPAAELAGTEALMASGFTPTTASMAPAQVSELVSKGVLDKTAADAYGTAYSSAFGQPTAGASIQEGFKAAAANPGAFFKQNMFPIGAAALPLLMSGSEQRPDFSSNVDQGQIRPYTYSQTRNKDFGFVPGTPYFSQSYTAGTPYAAKEGGIVELAAGGPVERMSMNDMKPGMYPQGMIASAKYATPSQVPASMEMVKSDYDVGVNPMTGLQDRNMAGGGIVALADGGVPPVEQIQLAPNLGRYSQPAPAVNPSVAAYNQILADRAANEYVVQPPLLPMLPGGGERATAADTSKIINEYYLKNLGRQGEQAGLDYWTKRKMETGESLADINKAIGGSQEGQIFGLYRDVLGRRPDEQGAAFWQSQLASGVPLADIRKAFETSQEFKARPQASAPSSTTKQTGFKYDPVTGTYSGGLPQPQEQDLSGMLGGMDLNDPGFQNYLRQQYIQSQQISGGKAGGLMPNNLKSGGISDLGDYSDGGRLLKGPGDGVSDSIPAQIGERQPARLADGEFVVPARIVSELGNGSTDAGARKLYAMMDRVQKKRRKTVGKDKVAVDTKSEGVLPA